jgi:hypothetical protein
MGDEVEIRIISLVASIDVFPDGAVAILLIWTWLGFVRRKNKIK